jgi:hypothetical protein
MRRGIKSVFLGCLLLFLAGAAFAEPRTDPETNVIRLLHIGKAWYQGNAPGPVFVQDSKINWVPVPAHAWSMGAEAFRALRLYLPRTKERFITGYDVVLIDGMEALHLRQDFQTWVVDGFKTEGINFVMADDSSSFGTSGSHTSWYEVPIGEILPVEDEPVGPYWDDFHVVPVDPEHEFTRNVPWDEVWMEAANRPWTRQGATVVTKMSDEPPLRVGNVQMVYWDSSTGGGRSVAWIHHWVGNPVFWRWRYHPDVVAHVIYYTARVPIPEDLVLIHRIREMLGDFYYDRVYAISTMDFADRFGANIRPMEIRLEELTEMKGAADRHFIDQEYEEAAAALDTSLIELEQVVREAIDAKDRALVWIFVIEWLTVTGTSMVAGTLLWMLMVKRTLYRKVGETKLKVAGET